MRGSAGASTRQSRFDPILTVGQGAIVTSSFAPTDELLKERHESGVQQCELAEKVIANPSLSTLVADPIKRHLLEDTYQRLELWLKR